MKAVDLLPDRAHIRVVQVDRVDEVVMTARHAEDRVSQAEQPLSRSVREDFDTAIELLKSVLSEVPGQEPAAAVTAIGDAEAERAGYTVGSFLHRGALSALRTQGEAFLKGVQKSLNQQVIDDASVDPDTELPRMIATGELLSTTDLAKRLGISRQALNKGQKSGRYFALQHGRNDDYYPAFFADMRLRNNGLFEVMDILHEIGPWERLMFLSSPSFRLGRRSPLDALREGRPADLEIIKSLARAMVSG